MDSILVAAKPTQFSTWNKGAHDIYILKKNDKSYQILLKKKKREVPLGNQRVYKKKT